MQAAKVPLARQASLEFRESKVNLDVLVIRDLLVIQDHQVVLECQAVKVTRALSDCLVQPDNLLQQREEPQEHQVTLEQPDSLALLAHGVGLEVPDLLVKLDQ